MMRRTNLKPPNESDKIGCFFARKFLLHAKIDTTSKLLQLIVWLFCYVMDLIMAGVGDGLVARIWNHQTTEANRFLVHLNKQSFH